MLKGMADQENTMRLTRAAAKRKAEAAEGNFAKKNRVVLGELPNSSSNVVVPAIQEPGKQAQKPNRKGNATKVKKALPTKSDEVAAEPKKGAVSDEKEVAVDADSDETQMCEPYVCDIYDYLRKMEVNLACF